MILRRFLLLLGLISSFSISAQDIKLCYEHVYDAGRQVDTLKIYLKGDADTTLSLRAVNFSVAYHDSCAVFDTLESYVTGTWGVFFEQTRVLNGLFLDYNRRNFDARVQYGNSDPGLPMPNPVLVPNSINDSLLIFKLIFRGRCSQKIYIENEADNSLNQFADNQFNRIDYDYFSCQGQDSVFFCSRQERDSVGMRDSLRLFIAGNAERSIGLSEVTFSVAFHDSCAAFDSLHSRLNAMWGDTLACIEVQDSLQLKYGGEIYDSRLLYRHQNPNYSAFNLLRTPSQTRFPEWISTLYFSGSCSQDIYIESQTEQPKNFMLNQLDRPVGYRIGVCDSLPEDTLVLSLGELERLGWKVFPNPVGEQLFVENLKPTIFTGNLQLMNLSGKIIWNEKVAIGREMLQIDMSDFPAAVYLLKIEGKNGKSFHIRLLKK